MIRMWVRSGMVNARAKGKRIGRQQVTVESISAIFLLHYAAYRKGALNVSELARVCDLSRTTVYKYISLLDKARNRGPRLAPCYLFVCSDRNLPYASITHRFCSSASSSVYFPSYSIDHSHIPSSVTDFVISQGIP